jgi:hypothetical protein
MKHLTFFAFAFLCGAIIFAESPVKTEARMEAGETAPARTSVPAKTNALAFNWSLLMSGSWEESTSTSLKGTLHNREEIRLNFLQPGLILRGQVLDRRTLNLGFDKFQDRFWNGLWGDSEKVVTGFLGGLYHKSSGSRLLFGTLDEWGLSARIRNPWIRSPPYAENHKPLIADLKTAVSLTKNDEAYLYLSSPFLNIFQDVKLRGFVTVQTEIENFTPTLAGGVDFGFPKKTGLLFEFFYTGTTLPPTKGNTWFSAAPALPEREFDLYAAGLIFHNQFISVSSDWALSETFAWGTDVYGNLGISLTPLLPFGNRVRPLSVSIAADGAGERFVYRDGANHGEGFRSAAKIEWKGRYNSLLRLNTTLRGPGIDENFNRSSTGFYFRLPSKNNRNVGSFPVRLTRMSLTADRNAENLQKISDRLSGYIGFSMDLWQISIKNPLEVTISGSITGLTALESFISPYPVPVESWDLDIASMNCDFTFSPSIFQFRSRVGYTNDVKKNGENDKKWIFYFSTAARFRYGRLSIKAATPNFPEKWNWTASWRLEKTIK